MSRPLHPRRRAGAGRPSTTGNVELVEGRVAIGVLGDYMRLLPEPAVAPQPKQVAA